MVSSYHYNGDLIWSPVLKSAINILSARVAELVDAVDSKSTASNGVPVQVRPLVPSLFEGAQAEALPH